MGEDRDPAWMWTRYWRSGQQDCCAGEDVDLSGLWRDFFAGFADGARLLDLATGAGQVAGFAAAAAAAAGKRFEIEGVDIAEVPAAAVPSVRLVGNTPLESLPVADASFDGVVSQFGIEYAEQPAATREAARVLKPGGCGLFVLHHAGGAIANAAHARLALYAAVLGSGSAFRAAERVFAAYRDRAPLAVLDRAEARLRGAVEAMAARLGNPPGDANVAEIVAFLADLARAPQAYDPADALARLAAAEEEALGWRLRQAAQTRAALTESGVAALAATLAAAGLRPAAPEPILAREGEAVAWRLAFHRPG